MTFIVALRLSLLVIVAGFLVAQIFVPLLDGRAVFPLFRRRARRVEKARQQLLDDINEAKDQLDLKRMREIKERYDNAVRE